MQPIQEQWRPIAGWGHIYEVSNQGRVRSIDRRDTNGALRRGRILKLETNPSGYLTARLYCRTTGRKGYTVHRLVAEAFLGKRPDGQVIRHLNDIKTDNRLENLAYGSYSDNAYEAVTNGKQFPAYRDACRRGHEYTPENTRIRVQGNCTFRVCRECVRIHSREAEARRKAKKSAL